MKVDPAFQKSQERARKRRTQKRVQLGLVIGGSLLGIAAVLSLVGWLVFGSSDPAQLADATFDEDDGPGFVQVEDETPATPIRAATPFVDIAGDPMILRFEQASVEGGMHFPGPQTLDALRLGDPNPDRLTLVIEELIVQERQLITALPSSREDFAFFQAQRSQSLNAPTVVPALVTVPVDDEELETIVVSDDDDDSWGAAIGEKGGAATTYVATRIENTTSLAFVKAEASRRLLYDDTVIRLVTDRKLGDLLKANGYADAVAEQLDKELPILIDGAAELKAGSIIALRNQPDPDNPIPLQVSIYGPDGYMGSAARRGSIGYASAADPWIDQDLFALASPTQNTAPAPQDYRLLDAIYSAAIRSGVPTTLVGEMIVMLSKDHDLDAFAAPGDKITLLFAPAPGPEGAGPGQILFAGIKGPSGDIKCYVGKDGDDGAYSCFGEEGRPGSAGSGGGFSLPVQGTMTSPFGPRFHPILKEARLHGGVDWAAPTGTPVIAALPGRITRANVSPSYGNIIYIDHPGGLQSRYAHLDRFAAGIRNGGTVAGGGLIGYVGTTGRSTGPHLHFEMRLGGEPKDPLTLNYAALVGTPGATVASAPAASSGVASAAVEGLVNQIIRVESGGNAAAKNPLSTATGLGQFIQSTWLRMMRDYRPDLARTMSRQDLLNLRTDPTLSREMVTNLARENERFLQSRGHSITAGRLYLAHFLGPGGANRVLSSNDAQTIFDVMGAGVVRANPFLTNYTVADLKAWADRKMRGSGSASRPEPAAPRAPPPPRLTAEMKAYIEAVNGVIEGAG